jgi:hypothetical protein
MSEADVSHELAAFIRERNELRKRYDHQWVVFAREQFQRAFNDYEGAARYAIQNFGAGPFLVRNLDDHDEQVPLIFVDDE